MTNHWNDIANSDCVMIIGCNPAENHPVSFRWITKAMDQGAKLIVVDPRFTRSAAKADLYVRLRPGTDIALIGGLINYVLQNDLYQKDYVANYTNAAFLVNKDFGFQNGLFSGYDKDKKTYNPDTWSYELDAGKNPLTDPTLANPHSVFQIMKQFYARYTPELVEEVTGVPKQQFLEMAAVLQRHREAGEGGTLLYAMGGTQHTPGVQIIRSYTILQQLLGNMGFAGRHQRPAGEEQRPGLHRHGPAVQHPPGYLPVSSEAAPTLKDYNAPPPRAATGRTGPNFSSASSRLSGARRPPRGTTSPMTTCPRRAKVIRAPATPGFPCLKPWVKAPSRA